MINNKYTISLSLKEPISVVTDIKVVQNDKDVNTLNIKIIDGTSEIDYTQVNTAAIVFAKADGTTVYSENVTISSEGFTYTMGTNEIAKLGKVNASLQMFGLNGERITSPRFIFDVITDLTNTEVIQSTTEFPPLQELIGQAKAALVYEPYDPNKSYEPPNRVVYNGSSYQNLQPCQDVLPTDDRVYWLCIAGKGDQGLQGEKGDTGAVPNIQVGTVTTLMPGNPVTVTRQTGSTDEAPIFDFAIPRGIDGTGAGNMNTFDYDNNGDGVVNDTDKLGGQLPEYYAKSADFTSLNNTVNSHLFDMVQNANKVIRSNDGKYNSWPVITKAPNGDILVFYNKGSQHINGDPTRAVVYKRSTDFGMTWSDEATILNDTYDDGVFSVGTTSAGTIIIIIRRVISDTTNYDQVVLRSTDNGYSWSAPVAIPVLPVSTISVSPILEVEGHGLMASFNDRPYSCELIWSPDDGVTWGNRQTITIPADPNDAPLECRFVYMGGGKIFGIGRTNVVGAGLFQLQSEDYGANWTVLKTNITDHYMTPTALIYQNSEVDIVYYHRATGALRQRHASTTDIWGKPLFWSESKVISYGSLKGADAGYPHAINLINDTCLCVYYSGSGNDTGTGGSAGIYGVLYSFKNNMNFKTPTATTANLTYYVDKTNGLDTNDGLTSGTAFKTITKAISMVPQIINHTVTVNIATGDYSSEGGINLIGYVGKSSINFYGDTAVSTNVTINRMGILRCYIPIVVRGINITNAGTAGIAVSTCSNATISYCNIIASWPTLDAISFTNSTGTINNCVLSNKANAIKCTNSQVYSDTNSGTGNTVGLSSEKCGTIGKNGTQPSGTTAESVTTGGVIR
jgi:hypothetical protein